MWSYISNKTPSNQNQKQSYQIFDLLQMSQQEKDLKNKCLCSIHKLKKWKKEIKNNSNDFFYYLEGYALKRRQEKNLLAYRIFRKNRAEAFLFYINELPVYGQNYNQSK